MARYIVKIMNLEIPKYLIIQDGESKYETTKVHFTTYLLKLIDGESFRTLAKF